ncbi:MAG: hypothetical protein RLZZ15_3038 [Verrucomicrobiota bacterium]
MKKSAATTLDAARINCSPKPLSGQDLADFWVETDHARDAFTDFRSNLKSILAEDSSQKVLVHGHRGCGKSTELNKFITELGPEWLVVALNAGDFLPTSGNEAADVLLAACTRIIEVAKEKELPVNEKALAPVAAYFAETTRTDTESRESKLETEAGADVSDGILGKLIGLKAKLVAALKFGSRTEQSTVHHVRRRKGELCAAVNALGIAVETAWQEKTGDRGARLLLVIEELDKLGLTDARQIFVHDGRILSEVGFRAVYTIPVFTFHSADAGAIRSYFEHDLALPMIKVFDATGKPCVEGRAVLTKIVRERVAASVLPDDALGRLIERTGGVLRDIFDAIQTAAQFNTVRKSGRIDPAAIGQALDRMVTNIGLQIAYPPDEKKEPKPLQEKLAAIAKAQAQGRTNRAQPDPDIQLLLMSGALLEYNGTGWLGVHPLARDYLKSLEFDVG